MPDMPGQAISCLVNISREQSQQDLLMVIQGYLHALGVVCVLHLKHRELAAQHRKTVHQAPIARCTRDEHVETYIYLEES